MTSEEITRWLVERSAAILNISPAHIDPAEPFTNLGMDSMSLLDLAGDLAAWLDYNLPPSLVWEHPTIHALAAHLGAGLSLREPDMVAVDRGGPLPQTFAQERMWRSVVAGGPEARQIVARRLVLQGSPLNIAVLQRCFLQMVERHESLRTTFSERDGEPVQVIHPTPPTVLRVVDLASSTEAEKMAWNDAIAEFRESYDVATGPLARFTLYILGGDDYRLCLNLHHIICDGLTIPVFVQELSALYQQALGEIQSSLPPLPIQVADFAHWQRQWLKRDGATYSSHLQWWNAFLGSKPPAPACADLRWTQPPETPDPSQTSTGETIETSVCHQLREIATREGSTLASLTLAAFMVALAKHGTPTGALVGSYVSDRRRPAVKNLLGLFVNLTVLRMPDQMDGPFPEVLRRITDTLNQVNSHQDFPFENLAEARAASGLYPPHPQVIFNHRQAVHHSDLFSAGLKRTNWTFQAKQPGVPWGMSVTTTHTNERLHTSIHFDSGLYEPARVRALHDDFVAIMKAVAAS